jgi:hypothetical protein
MNLSTADLGNYRTEFHETWWSYRYMFLVDPKVFRFVVMGVKAIFLVKGVGVTIESYGKLEISYINVFKIFKMSAIFIMAAKTRHKNGG